MLLEETLVINPLKAVDEKWSVKENLLLSEQKTKWLRFGVIEKEQEELVKAFKCMIWNVTWSRLESIHKSNTCLIRGDSLTSVSNC